MQPNALTRRDRIVGCLLGGAVGDALGAAIEFQSLEQIRSDHGFAGLQEPASAYGRLGAITDDTQLTMFICEGLLEASAAQALDELAATAKAMHRAMLRWLFTQGVENRWQPTPARTGLLQERSLFSRRAPGATCLNALRTCREAGQLATNDSKGCGALMRVAPIGLIMPPSFAGPLANLSARHTHGHPESTYSSEYFARLVAHLTAGAHLREALQLVERALSEEPNAETTVLLVRDAIALADSSEPTTAEVLSQLGQGWVAEEALAMAVFCALRAEGFEHGLRLAVNHGGDSDSTGSLVGQLLGTWWGVGVIPARWLDVLELRELITSLGENLTDLTPGSPPAR